MMKLNQKALKKLEGFGHNPENFEMKILYVYSPDNLGRYMGDEHLVLLPKEYAGKEVASVTDYIMVDEQMSCIECYNNEKKRLFTSIGEGYSDDERKTTIFFLGNIIKMSRDTFWSLKEDLNLSVEQAVKLVQSPLNLDLDEKVQLLYSYGMNEEEVQKTLKIGKYYQLEEKKQQIIDMLSSETISPVDIQAIHRILSQNEKKSPQTNGSNTENQANAPQTNSVIQPSDTVKMFDDIIIAASSLAK